MSKFYKILFTSTLIMSTLISISSQSWLGMWLGLEINLLSMIPLINYSNNMMASEASIKYFITQALASTILLFAILMLMNNFFQTINCSMILNSALMTKMGAAPFHFWFPEVMEGLNWINSLILLTWQKIAPMIIIMYNNLPWMFNFIIVSCMLISGIMGINQISMRKILAYSSINHIGWMIAALSFSENIWLFYFIVYSTITLNIVLIMNKTNTFNLKQMFTSMSNKNILKIFFILNFMSLGGLPPFLGFFPKWITIQTMVFNYSLLMPLMMILMTLVTLFFYMRITFSTILLSSQNNKINFKTNEQYWMIVTFNFLSIMGLVACTLTLNLI